MFSGTDDANGSECLSSFVVTWIAAIEKVRQWKYDGIHAQIMGNEKPHHLTPAEIDFSQFDPWQKKVPCPWRIDRPARVNLYWWSRPSNKGMVFYHLPFRWQRVLNESQHDELVVHENGVDLREFVKIDISDRIGWARAEINKIDRELLKEEGELRRLGLENTGFKSFWEMEQRPVETLTKREKRGLETEKKILGLAWRRASLKRSFGL